MRHSTGVRSALLASTLALAVSGCSFPNRTATSAAAMASGNFSSGETLMVLKSLSKGEIDQAELAKDKTEKDVVEDVAETIIEDHRELDERIRDLEQKGIEPEKSPLSRGFASQAEQVQEELATLAGSEFDCTFLNKQVQQHQLALDTLRGQVQPDVADPQIRELVKDSIAVLEDHREAAARARNDIRGCS